LYADTVITALITELHSHCDRLLFCALEILLLTYLHSFNSQYFMTAWVSQWQTILHSISKQIHLVGKRFRLKVHQNTANSYFLLTFRSLIRHLRLKKTLVLDESSYQLSHAYDRFLGMSSSSSRRAWRLVGWLGFNGTFCTNRPYRAI